MAVSRIPSMLAVVVAVTLHLLAIPSPVAAKDGGSTSSAKKTEVAASHPHEYYGYPHASHSYGGSYGGGHGGYAGAGHGGYAGAGGYGPGHSHGEFEFGNVAPSYKTSLGCHHKGFDLIPWFLMALGAIMLIPLFGALVQFKMQALAPLFGFQGQTPLVTTQVGGTRTTLQARLLNEIWPVVDKAIEHYTGMATEELKKEALNAVNAIHKKSKK